MRANPPRLLLALALPAFSSSFLSSPTAPLPSPHPTLLPTLLSARLPRSPSPRCEAKTWEELGLREELISALNSQQIPSPNPLQASSLPMIMGRASVVLGAQTGSGKTLAYLAPVMQNLKIDEEERGGRGRAKRPRALVLLPTRELSLQVRDVAKSLSSHLKLSVSVIHGGVPEGPQRRQLNLPIDLLIATPGRLVQHLDKANVHLGGVRYVVLDEVDTMFEQGFGPELDKILAITTRDLSHDVRALEEGRGRVQHLAVGATHPAEALAAYDKWLGGAKRLFVESHHSLPASLEQRFITCAADAKVGALREVLGPPDESGKPSIGRLVLFCNSQQSARFVDHTLSEDGYITANYHGAVPANQRASNFESFVKGEAHVLVTTDLAARGLDCLDVEHVVHFDFPKSAADYVHRCGRTARAGKRGVVHSLVTKHDSALVGAIRGANKAGGDVVLAGDELRQAEKRRKATELTPLKRSARGATASFPESFGLDSLGAARESSTTSRGRFETAEPREASGKKRRGSAKGAVRSRKTR